MEIMVLKELVLDDVQMYRLYFQIIQEQNV